MPRVALATHYLGDNRFDDAERLARQAVRLDDSDIEGNFILGEILLRKADRAGAGSAEGMALMDEARMRLRRALANAPGDVASLLALGRLELAAGKPTLARSYYRRVVMERRNSLEAHRALAELAEGDGDLEQAVEHLWEVRRLDRKAGERVSADLVRLYGELLRREESRRPAAESGPTTQP
jgi:tetratricopeptide (TPR) repeat protein